MAPQDDDGKKGDDDKKNGDRSKEGEQTKDEPKFLTSCLAFDDPRSALPIYRRRFKKLEAMNTLHELDPRTQ